MQPYKCFKTMSAALIALLATLAITGAPALAAEPAWARSYIDACNSGDRSKCLILGSAFSRGEFQDKKFKKDRQQAQRYIKKGLRLGEQQCGQDKADACYDIGVMYFEGGMVETDFPRGMEYVQKSCKLGYEKACVWLEDSGLNLGGIR